MLPTYLKLARELESRIGNTYVHVHALLLLTYVEGLGMFCQVAN